MAVLTTRWIREHLARIENAADGNVSSASYDLRWNGEFREPALSLDGAWQWSAIQCAATLTMRPATLYLLSTMEYLRMPPDVLGLIFLRSTPARGALSMSPAGVVEPGFSGEITLEFFTLWPAGYTINVGYSPAQIVFLRCDEEPQRDYRVFGHYNGQRGPTLGASDE